MAGLFDKASEALGKGMDAAGDIFGRGVSAASDLASSAGDLGKRGVIRAKLADNDLEYERLMKKLGTVLYEELKNDPKYVDAHQALFKEIATCVDRRQVLEDELSEIDAAAAASKPIDVEPVKPVAPEGAGPAASATAGSAEDSAEAPAPETAEEEA